MGFGNIVCDDFDLAVRALKRVWDQRRDEMMLVVDNTPTKNRKPMKPVHKYKSLYEVLGLNKDGTKPERIDAESLALEDKMAKQFAGGTIDWSEFNVK